MKRLLEDFMKNGCKCWIKDAESMKREVLNFQNIKKAVA